MKRTLRTRLAAAAVTAMAMAGAVVIAAPAAQAAPSDCTAYLAAAGYSSTDTNLACTVGGSGLPADQLLCRLILMNVSSVPPALAQTACTLAKL
ncbi:hypothetical protein ACWGHM_00715 [Streptomyces sp. NPDC054904]|uniref:hypothetical protein n=1 Tax=unclassified Streptomyces TaxID=2593676 RepID=UPI002481DB36|nr:hypothetical protein [Streptomyces sp. Isolate_45]MDA5279195.1 hypothetical protein [Streptomyces sp. Isolate_45]